MPCEVDYSRSFTLENLFSSPIGSLLVDNINSIVLEAFEQWCDGGTNNFLIVKSVMAVRQDILENPLPYLGFSRHDLEKTMEEKCHKEYRFIKPKDDERHIESFLFGAE